MEDEGFRPMVGPEAIKAEGMATAPSDCAHVMDAELSLVTVNVDGLGTYRTAPATRMDEILTAVLAFFMAG